jgi:hypothetical protein
MKSEPPPKTLIDTADPASGPYLLHCTHCRKLLLPEHNMVILGSNVAGVQRLHAFHQECWQLFPGGQ